MLKQVPQILEKPIIVMQSKGIDSRITMFGEVYDSDGLPIMAVLELLPLKDKSGVVLDEIKVVSTHSRKNNNPNSVVQTQSIIDTSEILYVEPNIKRTNNWLTRTRLQLPFGVTNYGSIKRITYPNGNVNTNNMQKSQNNAQGKGGRQHLLGGESSVVADNKTLAEARRMNLKGEPQSEIFKKTGWYKGLDNKWKKAIDEKDAELFKTNDKQNVLGEEYTYEALINKSDMPVTILTNQIPIKEGNRADRAKIIQLGYKNARQQNNSNNTGIETYVYVKDADSNVMVGRDALRHGLERNYEATAKVTMQIGDILRDSIRVNELNPREKTTGGYVLLGIGKDDENNFYPTRIVVNKGKVDDIEVLYAVKAQKKSQSPNGAGSVDNSTPLNKGSTITIADFLNVVKDSYADVLSDDVLEKLNKQRPKSVLADSVKYMLGEEVTNGIKTDAPVGGETSVVADNKTLAEARRMNLKGEPQSEIFKKTGWYKGLDNKWKKEIDPNDAKLFDTKNIDLSDDDLIEYMKTGKTLHTRNKKQRMLEKGKKPILTSSTEIKNFIADVIHGKAPGEVRAFKKVGQRLANAIYNKKNSLQLLGRYLEINADDLREPYKIHSEPKEKGDIPLREQDFENIPEYLDEFDGVLSVNTYNGKVEIYLYKETQDGYVKILTVASKERNSLQVTKLIGVSKEKFVQKYSKKIEGDIGSLWSKDSNPSTTAQHTADVPSTESITSENKKVKHLLGAEVTEETETEAPVGGETSVVADNKTLAEARRMNLKGEPQSEIFKKTGWYKGLDNMWKKEIDEKDAELFSVDNGMITTKYYDELIEEYGAIPKGEKPYREIQVPQKTAKDKKVSQTVRTILEAKATPEETVPTIEKMVEDGVFSYDVYTDKQAIKDAEDYLKEYGWNESLRDWLNDVEKGIVSKQHTAMGWALYNNAANTAATSTSESERKTAIQTSLQVLDAMVRHQRSAAQALQATRILKKLSPETQLYGVQKSVSALQKELVDKYGEKAPNLKINEELAEQYIQVETQEERDSIAKEIYKDIGRQMPSRFIDKWNAWRYLAMLGNPRTHIRNIAGNAFFAPVVATKNLTATAIESVVGQGRFCVLMDKKEQNFRSF